MTNNEYLAQITGINEPIHIEAFKMILSELQENNPEVDFNWCLPKYRAEIDWLNDEYLEKMEVNL